LPDIAFEHQLMTVNFLAWKSKPNAKNAQERTRKVQTKLNN